MTVLIGGREMSGAASTVGVMDDLNQRQQKILAFERQWWKYAGAKDTAIREEFGCSATRYYQELTDLIRMPAALVHDPMLVKRLCRIRDERAAGRRGARRLG